MSKTLRAWLACGMILVSLGAAKAQQAAQPAAKMLPGNCLLYVEVKNVTALQEAIKKTGIYGLYTDPAMKEFVSDAEKRITEAADKWLKDAWKSSGIENPPEKLPRPEGRIVWALRLVMTTRQVPNAKAQASSDDANAEADDATKAGGTHEVKTVLPQFFVLVDMGSHADAAKDLVKQMAETSTDPNIKRSQETIHGLEVHIMTSSVAPAPATPDGPQTSQFPAASTAWAWQGNTLLICSDVEFFKEIITRMDSSDQESLADDKDLQKALRKLEGDQADVWAYVNAKAGLEIIKARHSDSAEDMQQYDKVVKALGFDGLSGAALALAIAPNAGEDYRTRLLLGIDGTPRGVLEVLTPPAMSTKPTALLTRDVASFAIANCDIAKLYDTVLTIAQEISGRPIEPMIQAAMKQMAGEGNEPIDLRKDLMEQLSGPATMLVQASKPYDAADAQHLLVAIALRDGPTVDTTIGKLFGSVFGRMPTEIKNNFLREMNGVNIYIVPMGGLMPSAGTMKNPPALAVVGQTLFIGELESVQRAIRDNQKEKDAADSITADPMFEHASSLLPAQAAAFSYTNEQITAEIQWAQLKRIFAELKKQRESDPAGATRNRRSRTMNPLAQAFVTIEKYVDMSALPEFAAVRQHFGATVGSVTSSDEGLFMEVHYVKPPAGATTAPAK